MVDVERYFDLIDSARLLRVRELSEIKSTFSASTRSDPMAVQSKAVVVLTYACWEGFYNECVTIYLDFLHARGGKVVEASWLLLMGALNADFKSLQNRNHSPEARRDFVVSLKDRISCDFDKFDRSIVMSKSNLDFDNLSENFLLLDFDYTRLQRSRIRLNKELVGWRHGAAHGDPPDLRAVDVASHVDFASDLMLVISDVFQEAILERFS